MKRTYRNTLNAWISVCAMILVGLLTAINPVHAAEPLSSRQKSGEQDSAKVLLLTLRFVTDDDVHIQSY